MSTEPVYVIGINGGATHTDLVLIDSNLNVLSRVSTGPTNFRNIGFETAISTVEQAIREVSQPVGIEAVKGLCACLAGVDHAGDEAMMRRELAARFPSIPPTSILIANDAAAALYGGAGQGFGIVIISGTGSICGGMNAQHQWVRAGGQGSYIDQGSGYDIAQKSLLAVWKADDCITPPTKLKDAILEQLGLLSLDQLMDWLYHADRQVDQIAALARATITLGESDPAARAILVHAADSLADYVIAVARRLGLDREPFPLLLSGGVLANSALLRDMFSAKISSTLPTAVIIEPHFDAPIGAALIALDALHIKWPVPPMR
jgi:N-acetylglucosamine kinase-like BadF-type ATPase